MDFIEVTGKSVDAAVFNGLQQLGVSIDEVKIETIQTETKGILGIGAKPAKVRLTLKAPEEIIIPDFEEESKKIYDDRADGRRHSDRKFRHDDRRRRNDRRYAPKSKTNTDNESIREHSSAAAAKEEKAFVSDDDGAEKPLPETAVTEKAENDHENAEPESLELSEKVNYTEEAALNNPAADFVRGLASRMGIEAKISAFTDEKNIKLRIDGENVHLLIGHRGETLDAIQYLTSLVVNKDRKTNGYKRVTVNTNDYREKREATLIRLAKRIGEQVRTTGRARTLEPMNPYERRILHATLQSNPYVTTHSEGEDPNRKVIVTPVKHHEKI